MQRILESRASFLLPDKPSGSNHETQAHFNVQNTGQAAFPWEAKGATNSKCTHLKDELKTSALPGTFLSKRALPWVTSPSPQHCNVVVFLKKNPLVQVKCFNENKFGVVFLSIDEKVLLF